MTKLAMRTSGIGLAAILAIGLFGVSPAVAEERVILSGKHTKAQVDAACKSVGGHSVQGTTAGAQGYGCYNPKNGVLVACDNGGDCVGIIPRSEGKPVPSGLSILGSGNAGLSADPFKPTPNPASPVRAPATRSTTPASPG